MEDLKFKARNGMDLQTVKIHNEMARTLSRFTEERHGQLFLASIAHLMSSEDNVARINKVELFDKLNVPKEDKHKHTRYFDMFNNMRKKTEYDITIDEDTQIAGNIIYKVKRTRNEYLIHFDEEMAPILKQLKNHFTEYQLTSILDLHSSHSISLYNYLMSWHDYKKQAEVERRYLSTKELKDLFGLSESDYMNSKSDKFDRYNFEKKCVQKAVDDIVENANMNIRWCKAKAKLTGKVIAYVFDFVVYPYQGSVECDGILTEMKYGKQKDIIIDDISELED